MTAKILILIIAIEFACTSCKKEVIEQETNAGKIEFEFVHKVRNESLYVDSLCYLNQAGNPYEVDELKYFISDVYFYNTNGAKLHIDAQTAIHYVDIDYPETLVWKIFDPIPTGTYDSVSFVFGLNEERNISFAFVNPPEVNMFWPTVLGGGFHYLMLNGKWKNPQGNMIPFDFHLGIGQTYSGITSNVDSITGFVQNYFEVTLPLPTLMINDNSTNKIQLAMDIESWFETPHTWDFNDWGNYIMQNQLAMKTACENGYNVFSISSITNNKKTMQSWKDNESHSKN
ncbi:MAG: hypothetical protein IPH88_16930 [Bacteroidales bacterium]|nr:hypothetical protein [Bacteroidales bacterium]